MRNTVKQAAPMTRGQPAARRAPVKVPPELSPILHVTLTLAANGLTNRQISSALGIPFLTVKSRMQTIYGKLGVRDRAHAVGTAFRLRMIQPEAIWDVAPRNNSRSTPGYCQGFPESCPSIITVPPDLPRHYGGIRCGCDS